MRSESFGDGDIGSLTLGRSRQRVKETPRDSCILGRGEGGGSGGRLHRHHHAHLFSGLAREDLARVAGKLDEVKVAAGAAIIRQAEPGDALYVVQAGAFEVLHRDATGALGLGAGVTRSGLLHRAALAMVRRVRPSYPRYTVILTVAGLLATPALPSMISRMAVVAPVSWAIAESVGFTPRSPGAPASSWPPSWDSRSFGTGEQGFSHSPGRRFMVANLVVSLLAIVISVPWWQAPGLIR